MDIYGVIYKITDLTNNKIYIGATNNFNRRLKEYKNKTKKKDKRTNYLIMNIIREKGIENFLFQIIDQAKTKNELWEKEIYHISNLNTTSPDIGYNSKSGGLGGKLRNDSKLKMSFSSKKFKHTEVEKLKRSKKIIVYQNNKFFLVTSARHYSRILNIDHSIITSAIRLGKSYKGTFIYYADINERQMILEKFQHKTKFYEIGKMLETKGVETIPMKVILT